MKIFNIKYLKTMAGRSLLLLGACLMLTMACEDETEAISDNLRVILVKANGENAVSGSTAIEPNEAEIQLIFSHPVVQSDFESALSITGDPEKTITYDETGSFVTINFPLLDYNADYTISIPQGDYSQEGNPMEDDFNFDFTTREFVAPVISFSTDADFLEEGQEAVINVTLNKDIPIESSFELELGGNSEVDSDYTVDPVTFTFAPGETSKSFTVSTINDGIAEGEETLVIGATALQNLQLNTNFEISIFDKLPSLELKGVTAIRWTGETDGNSGKSIHLRATEDIADLSEYALGVANNGGGTDGIEYTFPAISVNAGDDILITREAAALESYYGTECFARFELVIEEGLPTQNGDDAIELFQDSVVVETYGDANVDGTGQDWEYSGSWAYKLGSEWITGGVDCTVGSTTTADASCTYPLCDSPVALKGVMALLWDGSGTNGGKAVHLVVNRDVPDLSIYGVGVTNNGGGTDGIEVTLPAEPASEGDHILIAREPATIGSYFGDCINRYALVIQSDAMNQNGDDGVELYENDVVIETYGDANVDGTGEAWEYSGAWSYKVGGVWQYNTLDCAATATSNANSDCPYAFCQ
ncbi:Ig-like domain-containing protein [Mangrovivirga cuniculi]|uniref:Nuclease n=1 Tax=Mangrovivirga cuniculi TaxID=2715131 RepID=A0A4D7JVR1_9BACT|nr:Ig-like domain-containing protein [Mangrovivirga cuniculi]QCK16266.1 nuclease [Mangrovivirga cuniculi]